MLLPSALPCDMRRPATQSRFTPSRLFTTPPPSDDDFPSSNGLLGTCRALQTLLNGSPAPSPRRAKPERLQSPLNIRSTPSARSRRQQKDTPDPSPKPSRAAHKRKRDRSEESDPDSDAEIAPRNLRFSTPKRSRHLPYDLPMGLSQSDFYSLHSPPVSQSPPSPAHSREQAPSQTQKVDPDAALPSIEETDEAAAPSFDDSWTADDDQRLVNLVLEKFQLSRRDWEECARRMGKDDASIGRRWQALVGEGNVGLRRGRRITRPRLDESWM
ncbi:hypothetical protein BDV25DRAFT_158003 [Aspergillus avenaceus]|uniref:Myb-like domain-containing protein n=1 Tax=Aspergillus avenaceus TaxID=36643 RepID=A0A5N6TQF8_ASPAV|nr:hypothetical protein BDV25DRAFT_158003 [Aspergillus avenaceus]